MDNIIKKFVDAQLKTVVEQHVEQEKEELKQDSPELFNEENEKELKKVLDKRKKVIKKEIAGDFTVENWLTNLLGATDFSKIDSIVPTPETKVLFDFLSLDFQCPETNFNSLNVMQAFKLRHPIINNSLDKFPLSLEKLELFSSQIEVINSELIELYLHFSKLESDTQKKWNETKKKLLSKTSDLINEIKKGNDESQFSDILKKLNEAKSNNELKSENEWVYCWNDVCENFSSLILELDSRIDKEYKQVRKILHSIKQMELKDKEVHFFNITSLPNTVTFFARLAEKATDDSGTFTQVTHAPKFSHPDSIYPRLFITKPFKTDGYLKTGNSVTGFDMHSGATELPICKLLYLKIEGKTLLEHFKSNNLEIIQNLFHADEATTKSWQEKFLCCVNNQDKRTSSLIKQVYFPVPATPDNTTTYHQLSILFPSALAFEFKRRIVHNNYIDSNSFQGKTHRNNNKSYQGQYPEIINLTLQRHGGTKPQNISALNNTHQNVYLLESKPPQLKGYAKELPTKAFFSSLWTKPYSNDFVGLHYVLRAENEENTTKRNNLINKFLTTHSRHKQQLTLSVTTDMAEIQPHHIKRLFKICIENIVHRLIEWIWSIRENQSGWSEAERFKALPLSDKILLDQKYQQSDDNGEVFRSEEWLKQLIKEVNVWIVSTYKEQVKQQQLPITSDDELIIKPIIEKHKEAVL